MTSSMYCRHQPACTGCPLSPLPYTEQLRTKQQRVARELASLPATESIRVEEALAAAPTDGYRLRAKLVYQDTRLGLYADDHTVVDTPDCRILHPRLRTVLSALRRLFPLPCSLLALDARLGDDGVLVSLIVPKASPLEEVYAAAHRILAQIPEIKGVAYSERAPKSPQVLGGVPVPIAGVTELRHTFATGSPYHLAVFGGFVQAHVEQTNALHDAIVQRIQSEFASLKEIRVVELYAGAGALALRLSKLGARVTAVDSYGPSVALLERTAHAQSLKIETLAAPAEAALERLSYADVVIVDPPRRGLSVEVRQAIARAKPRLLVYVSCDPRTLARDLSHLAWLGYGANAALPVDMIPNSDAVETLAVLRRMPPPPLDVLYRDDQLVVVNKPPHLPTTPHPEHTDSLLARVQALPSCERAAPVHRLDAGTSGVCLFATEPKYAERLGQALSEGQKTYVALAEGITHKRGNIRKALLEGRVPRQAETRYTRVDVVGTHSLIHAQPVQGRKHQIRRHLASVGHALLGDVKYARSGSARFFFERHGLDRPFLHCAQIDLVHGSKPLSLKAALASDLQRVLDSLTAAATSAGWQD